MVGALKPFAQLKVVELAGSIGGAYCGVGAATNASRCTIGTKHRSDTYGRCRLVALRIEWFETLAIVATESPI